MRTSGLAATCPRAPATRRRRTTPTTIRHDLWLLALPWNIQDVPLCGTGGGSVGVPPETGAAHARDSRSLPTQSVWSASLQLSSTCGTAAAAAAASL